jgi:hypothetical protein
MDGDIKHVRKEMTKPPSSPRGYLHVNTKGKGVAMMAIQSMKLLSAFGVSHDEEDFSDQDSSVRLIL